MSMDDQNITRISPPQFGAPKRPKQPSAIEESLEVTRQLEQEIETPKRTKRSTHEQIAMWVESQTWGEAKTLAKAVLGDSADDKQIVELADKFYAWAHPISEVVLGRERVAA